MSRRRKKTFDERQKELSDSLKRISEAIATCETSGEIYPLRDVAVQLRALLADRHPLLIELAEERGFDLKVYMADPAYTKKILVTNPIFYTTGDAFALHQDPMFPVEVHILEAINALHVVTGGEQLTVKGVIKMVADTEAAHYDPGKPLRLDDLGMVEFGGLSAQYRTIYSVGRVVRDLGFRFLKHVS
jgi:hypothetical protein